MRQKEVMDQESNTTELMVNDNNSHISSADVAEAIALTAILTLSLVGNGLVCYCGLMSTRILAMNHLIVNLAFAEILLAVLVLPARIQRQLVANFEIINPNLCKLLQYFQTVALGVINIAMATIALDRYFSIFQPSTKITVRKAKYMQQVLSFSISRVDRLIPDGYCFDAIGMRVQL